MSDDENEILSRYRPSRENRKKLLKEESFLRMRFDDMRRIIDANYPSDTKLKKIKQIYDECIY